MTHLLFIIILNYLDRNIGWVGAEPYYVIADFGIDNLGIKLDLLNVKYVLSSYEFNKDNFNLVFYDSYSDIYIYEYIYALPKAYIVHNAEVVESADELLAILDSGNIDIKECILLEEYPENISLTNADGIDSAVIKEYNSERIVIDTTSETSGFLVLSETWYPCWIVYIDNVEADVYKTDYSLMSVYLDAGEHNIQFVYKDNYFKAGTTITCISVVLIVTLLIIDPIIKRKKILNKINTLK